MHLYALSELVYEQRLIDKVDSKLLEDSSEVSLVNKFFLITLLLQQAHCVDQRAKNCLVLQQF